MRRVFNGRKRPDLREHVLLSRENARAWILIDSSFVSPKGASIPLDATESTTMGRSGHFGGGELSTASLMRRSHVRVNEGLRSRCLDPRQHTVIVSTCNRRNRLQARGVTRKWRSEERRPPTFHLLARICGTRRQALARWRGSLPVYLEGDRLSQACYLSGGSSGSGANAGHTAPARPECSAGEDWALTCRARASLS